MQSLEIDNKHKKARTYKLNLNIYKKNMKKWTDYSMKKS